MKQYDLSGEWARAQAMFPALKGYALERKDLEGRRVGECRLRRSVIVVEPGLSEAHAKKVLGHEIVHALLDKGGHRADFAKKLLETYLELGYLGEKQAVALRAARAGTNRVEMAALNFLSGF